ncbi:pentatricopeptide repeat-containing protein At1g69290-like [Malus sylvestris]|uniref:pentatricopeptide repeat-containing protein At1g69290-like n=1 Tax=Malus sylvestris TaxID=3752 RepID=UPI0021AD4978|nr:pentatricopeptide repeat-containing protein At1g69290-like [Malus sylvestris]
MRREDEESDEEDEAWRNTTYMVAMAGSWRVRKLKNNLNGMTLRGRAFSSTPEIPTLYSFLQPSIFALKRAPPPSSSLQSHSDLPTPPPETLTPDHIAALETALHKSLITHKIDAAWKSFKTVTGTSAFPSKSLTNSLITHLSSLGDTHNLKRAFATTVYVVDKNPGYLEFKTVGFVLDAMKCANTAAPAFALVKCMFKNRFFLPFSVLGNVLVEISRENVGLFEPGLAACNAALEGCCRELESLSDAEKAVETIAVLGIGPDESSSGFLAHLYALKGGFRFSDKRVFRSSLINGYVK